MDMAKSAARVLTRAIGLGAIGLGAIGLVLCAGPAAAQDNCNKPLQLLSSLPMTQLNNDSVVTVPIGFNGVQKQFLLDTGGLITQVSSNVADELKLRRKDSPVQLYGVGGDVSKKYATVQDFTLGSLHAPNLDMQISDLDQMDGLFAPVSFQTLDFEMDFAARKLNIISSDHCEGKVIYWPAKAVAVVPIQTRDWHITVPVTLDGRRLMAIVDTGASTSTVRLDIARRVFGLTPDSDGMKAVGHLPGDEKAVIYEHSFQTLTFEGVTVNNPQIQILTDVVNKNADHSNQTGSLIKKASDDLTLPEVIVGMDVLRKLHLYLALKEKKLYLTEASSPPDSTSAPR
jgi:hypothetical protein